MKESVGSGTKEAKFAKMEQHGDSYKFQERVDRWRLSNGLGSLYGVVKEKQVVTHG